ncbi:MAG: ABC transporter substrate-binding protein, partial [Terriglobales bacterium]
GTGALARPSRAKLGSYLRRWQLSVRYNLPIAAAITSMIALASPSHAATRPHYGGTLRVMLQWAPNALELPLDAANTTSSDYWDALRTLSLIGDTLVKIDALGRPQPALAVAWQSDPSARHWQFTLRRGVKFHDGSAATPAAIAQILGALHSGWMVRASADSLTIDSETAMPALLAELALPRNLLLKRNADGVPIGTGAFLVAEWQPGKLLKLAANEESWEGRPFVNAVEIEFGKSLRDQAIALELDKTDVIEAAPQAATGPQRHGTSPSSSLSLPVELLALAFPANSKVQDPRLREALALAIDRKPIQSVLLKGAGEPAASILPNWMTGYSSVFSAQANPQRARTLLADAPPPALNTSYGLSYDPRDPQAQLIAERIALNAREVGITLQVTLAGAEDIRLMRVVLPSADPATSLTEAARQLGLPQSAFSTPRDKPSDLDLSLNLEALYRAERELLDGHGVIPLFHLPLASAVGGRVHGWQPDRLGEWDGTGSTLADVWLADTRADSPAQAGPR